VARADEKRGSGDRRARSLPDPARRHSLRRKRRRYSNSLWSSAV